MDCKDILFDYISNHLAFREKTKHNKIVTLLGSLAGNK